MWGGRGPTAIIPINLNLGGGFKANYRKIVVGGERGGKREKFAKTLKIAGGGVRKVESEKGGYRGMMIKHYVNLTLIKMHHTSDMLMHATRIKHLCHFNIN